MNKDQSIVEINKLISGYAIVREEFEDLKKKYPEYLAGNDNYIGIIGEYWATRFLEQIYPAEAMHKTIEAKKNGTHNKSNEWSDFELEHLDAVEIISVKTIFEIKTGESGKIKHKKVEEVEKEQILSIIIVKLNDKLLPEELLYKKDINKNLNDGKKDYKTRWDNNLHINFKHYGKDGFDEIFIEDIYTYDNDKDNKFIQKIKK